MISWLKHLFIIFHLSLFLLSLLRYKNELKLSRIVPLYLYYSDELRSVNSIWHLLRSGSLWSALRCQKDVCWACKTKSCCTCSYAQVRDRRVRIDARCVLASRTAALYFWMLARAHANSSFVRTRPVNTRLNSVAYPLPGLSEQWHLLANQSVGLSVISNGINNKRSWVHYVK